MAFDARSRWPYLIGAMSSRSVCIAFCILAIVPISRAQSPPPPRIPPVSQAAENRISSRASRWMGENEFTTFFRRQHDYGMFAVMVEGRLNRGQREYRAVFDQFPYQNFDSFAAWGRGLEQYQNENGHLAGEGYEILSQQTFQDSAHNTIYQTVWVRKVGMAAGRKCLERLVQP